MGMLVISFHPETKLRLLGLKQCLDPLLALYSEFFVCLFKEVQATIENFSSEVFVQVCGRALEGL